MLTLLTFWFISLLLVFGSDVPYIQYRIGYTIILILALERGFFVTRFSFLDNFSNP